MVALFSLLASGCTYVTRASVDFQGGDACPDNPAPEDSCYSRTADLSADGRYVVFSSKANDLVPGDNTSPEDFDVFVRDLRIGTTTRVSVDTSGGDANNDSTAYSISADGRYVAFQSYASDLVPGDGNASPDVFVRDLHTGSTQRVSVDTAGDDGNYYSFYGWISANGRFVVFHSLSSDLVPVDGNGTTGDVFVRDLETGVTSLVSVDAAGGAANDESGARGATISADGRYVAFDSEASDLVAGDTNTISDVYVRDLVAGTTKRVSLTAYSGPSATFESFAPSISADGRYVAFQSGADDLVPGDDNGLYDVYVRDVQAGTTTRVSVDSAGGDTDHHSNDPSISADGRYIAFESQVSDLVPYDTNGQSDIFVRDMHNHLTRRVSLNVFGQQLEGASAYVAISADGRYVAFDSDAGNVVSGDGNDVADVFVRATNSPTVTSVTPAIVHRGSSAVVTVTGEGFLPGAQVSFSILGAGGVTVTSVQVIWSTELKVVVSVDAAAPVGTRNVAVWNPGTGPGPLATSWGVCPGCITVT